MDIPIQNKTKRTRCKNGTNWVESAQKCMTLDEKQLYNKNKTRKNKKMDNKNKKEVVVEAGQKEVVEEAGQKEVVVEAGQKENSLFSNFVNIFSKQKDIEETKKEETIIEETKIEEDKPENILLNEKQKKCPPNYIRHPPKSRNCTLIKKKKK